MKLIKADMHIHTCLSPCAEVSASPKRIVEKAYECGLNMIFITDHNSVENAGAAMRAARDYSDFKVYPGMEITSKEEVHTLALFENIDDAMGVQEIIYKNLPDVINERESKEQVIANEFDEVEGFLNKSLFSAVNLNIEEIIDTIHRHKGLAVAAHIDRESFSIISQLGFIPDDLNYDALEISPNMSFEKAKVAFKEYSDRYNFIKGSDSHSLDWIGDVYTQFYGEENSFFYFNNYIRKNPC
jgi:predicted metal-dependent phosphoesterase TrpH